MKVIKTLDSFALLDNIKASIVTIINAKFEKSYDCKNSKSRFDQPNDYELMVQNLEAEIRNHIRIEQQLKLCVESLQFKNDEINVQLEKSKSEIIQLKTKGLRDKVENQYLLVLILQHCIKTDMTLWRKSLHGLRNTSATFSGPELI